jgi:hypothetical protein
MKVIDQLQVIENNVKDMPEEKAGIIFYKTYLAVKEDLIALEESSNNARYLKGVMDGMNQIKK